MIRLLALCVALIIIVPLIFIMSGYENLDENYPEDGIYLSSTDEMIVKLDDMNNGWTQEEYILNDTYANCSQCSFIQFQKRYTYMSVHSISFRVIKFNSTSEAIEAYSDLIEDEKYADSYYPDVGNQSLVNDFDYGVSEHINGYFQKGNVVFTIRYIAVYDYVSYSDFLDYAELQEGKIHQ